ncbi:hypothetical protein Mame_03990 [Martelella mediterranea DSM 17316]|uniref:Uncharacterized protein n=1 Tax=Martelella mediterranea DSM 17316 TaxID=1122214 RepID=A0A1U9Z6I0_9HYPH|nr:hypothetical protein Mame_03990 [Martelella mediterranea DSM 17316]
MRSDNKAGTGRHVHDMDGRRGASRDDLIVDARRKTSRADEATANDLRDKPAKRAAAGRTGTSFGFRPSVFTLLCKRIPTFGGL